MTELKDRLGQLIRKAATDQDKARLVAAEQILIGFYFDVLKVNMLKKFAGKDAFDELDFATAQRAVAAIRQACADLGEEDIFKGDINKPSDLYLFAREITDLGGTGKSMGERARRQKKTDDARE